MVQSGHDSRVTGRRELLGEPPLHLQRAKPLETREGGRDLGFGALTLTLETRPLTLIEQIFSNTAEPDDACKT